MNKSFKVVFSKARSALMVVNEATSSVQAKGTKTVIAAAAAAMIAGGAMAEGAGTVAAPTAVSEATVTGSLVWTPNATQSSKSHYAGTDVTVVVSAGDAAVAWNETKHTIGSTTAMKLAGGQFVAAGRTESVDAMTGNGVITWDATKDTLVSLTAGGITLDKGEINIGIYDGKTNDSQKNSTVTSSDQLKVAEGTLHTYVAAAETGAVKHGTATLSATGAVTLGTAAKEGLSAGKDFNINSEVATNVSGTSVTYNQGSITNTADLTISADAGNGTKEVTFEKAVKIAKNTGSITLAGENVVFNSDYTAGGDNSGKLILKGTTKNSIGGAVKASSVMLGTYAADNADQKTVEVVLDGPTTVESGASVEAGNLWFAGADKALTVAGTLTADTTKVSASGAAVTVNNKATASLGDITIEAAASTANNLTVTNNAKADVTAKSLTIAAADKTNKAAGTFTLTSGAFTVGDLSNASGAKVAVGSDTAKSVFTVTGKATNAGTIELTGAATNNTTTLVVGADSAFTNTGSIAEANSKVGTLDVAGQLTNTGAGTIHLANLVVSGTLTTGVVTLDRDGAETKTPAFQFDSITLDKGVINVVADASGNALKTFYTETKDTDGKVTKTAIIHDGVWNFNGGNVQVNGTTIAGADYDVVMGGSAALTANFAADYEFGNVSVANNSQQVKLSVTDAANLKAKSVDLTNAGTGSAVNVTKGAALTTDKLTVAGATVALNDGTLTVNNVLTTSANSGTITVDGGSTLNVSAQALGFVDKNGALDLTAASLTTATGTLDLSNGAKFNVTGLDGQTLKSGVLSNIQGLRKGSMGQINLGNVTVTGEDGKGYVTDGKISYNVVNSTLGGIVTDDIANATVTGVEAVGFTNGGSFKDLQMKADAAVTVAQNTTLTLNGTGDLVTFTSTATDTTPAKTSLQGVSLASGAAFVTTGAGAVIGSVTKAAEGASGTNFGVEGTGSLTVKGNVDVGKLYTDAGAAVTVVKSDAKDAVASTVTVDTLEIDGAFTAADSVVALNGSGTYTATTPASAKGLAYIAGKALVKELSTSGDMFVTGTLDVTTKLSAAAGKTVYVGNEKSAGVLSVGSLESGKIFADPAWVDGKSAGASLVAVKTVAAAATVEAGRNSIVSLGTANVNDGVAALAKSGFTLADTPAVDDPATGVKAVDAMDTKTVNSVIYVNGGKTATTVATAIAGKVAANANSAAETVNNVNIAENSMLAIDMNTVATDGSVAVFEKAVTLNGVLYLDNVTNGQTVKLSAEGLETSKKDIDALFEGDMLMSAVQDATDRSKITVQMDAKSDIAMAGVSLPGLWKRR